MDIGLQSLSEITIWSKYAKYIPELNRRETWDEIVDRYEMMMVKKYPQLKEEIFINTQYIRDKKVLPSMRSLQFGGRAAEVANNRIFNCAYLPVDSYYAFSEATFLLLGGSGIGFSVQKHHVDNLPAISKPTKERRYLIADSIEGWADSVKMLMKAYLCGGSLPKFDFRDIREKGARLVTAGGKAPGPEPLKLALVHIQAILDRKSDGEKLTPLECHDIMCHIANAVLSGGIRRAAMISLFSHDDEEMLTCKFGNWWELNEQRGRSNNSVILKRGEVSEEQFLELWDKVKMSGSGEPGFYWTNDLEQGTNPCCFTGDTKILTDEGYKCIGDLEENTVLVDRFGNRVSGKIWSNGVKQVVKVTTSARTSFKSTYDHRLMDVNGNEVLAGQSLGTRLMPYFSLNEEINEFTKYGFIQGDGALSRLKSESHLGLEINIGKDDDDVLEMFGLERAENQRIFYVKGYNEIFRTLGFSEESLPDRPLPKTFSNWNKKDKCMFLKGMYSANGSIIKDARIAYKTTCKLLSQQLVEVLSSFGITAYITTNKEKYVKFSNGNYMCRESYDVNIHRYDSVLKFTELIGFIHQYKKESLVSLIKAKAPKVISVLNSGEEEVFDFSLDNEDHWGVVEGIIAHNCEIALNPNQVCNLCEVNAGTVESQEDLNERSRVAAFFGTLQAGFTDFHYLRPVWKRTTEKEALLGIGMTGIANGEVLKYDLKESAHVATNENKRIASAININESARVTCVKPSGSTSCVLGVSSGIHGWHAPYYLRTTRFNKNEAIAQYLMENHPDICEDDKLRPHDTVCVRIPIKAPEGAIMRSETALSLLKRVKKFSEEWVKEGHQTGINTHNVSCTISIRDKEWEKVGNWMWENKDTYNGISVLPYDGGSYVQAPFEDITEEEYNNRISLLSDLDLSNILEYDDNVQFSDIVACSGGACETA